MAEVKTNNVISTPNITGNIGSCETKTASVVSQRLSYWREQKTEFATNSCTGEQVTYTHWNYSTAAGITVTGVFITCIIGFFIFIAAIAD